ncbi:MAG: DUF3108 domain-containing protein [bacterium]|nr:DUF3108 domain-containing protein [bacterium]
MRRARHFTYQLLAFAAVFVLLSMSTMDSSRQKLETSSAFEIGDKLPIQANTAFKEGEVLTYRLHYGLLNAGMAVLEVKPDLIHVNGRNVYHIVGSGYSTGTTDWFFKVRDRYETYLDKDALLPWLFVRRVDEGGYKFKQDYVFNHYTKKVDIGNNQKYDVPSGVQDMVSAFYAGRNLKFSTAKVGEIISMPCFVDKEVWNLKIRYVGKEIIETDLGKFRCLKFNPIVQKGRVFKEEEDLTVWISDDQNHIPMRAQANVLVGSIKMDITDTHNLANATSKVN